jgi:hypothetical protein
LDWSMSFLGNSTIYGQFFTTGHIFKAWLTKH